MIFQIGMDFGSMNFVNMLDSIMLWSLVLFAVVIIGLFFWWIWNTTRFNVYVELIRKVGSPYEVKVDGKIIKRITYQSTPKKARIYNKKLRSGGFKEYFQISGTNFNYPNYFKNLAFYFRTPTWFLDFKRKGIKLLVDEKRGLVPLMVSNPGIVDVGTSLNEVVGSISDGLHEREMLYDQDFWAKYGNVVAIGMLIGFFVIGMIFIIKYQETFWENSMNGLQAVLKTIQDTASPTLK